MTPKALLTAIRDALRLLCWTGTSNKIFGANVYVTPETPIQQLAQWAKPSAFVIDQGTTNDPEHPCLMTQTFSIIVFVENVGSNYGEAVILGGNRVTGESDGAGSKDITAEMLSSLIQTTVYSAAKVVLVAKSTSKPVVVGKNNPLITVAMNFQSFVSAW